MAYVYETEKPKLFTDEGQRELLRIRDHAQQLISSAGAATCEKIINAGREGNIWLRLACVDRLVELGDLERVTKRGSVATQHEVYVSRRWG